MELQFTTVFRRVREGYMGFVEELPGANTQVIVAVDVEDRAGIDAMTSAAPGRPHRQCRSCRRRVV
jgi:hypothetical protein